MSLTNRASFNNANISTGVAKEVMFENFISQHSSTFRRVNIEELVTKEQVLKLAKMYCNQGSDVDGRGNNTLQTLMSALDIEDWRDLEKFLVSQLCDWLFGIDFLIEVEFEDFKRLISIDLTLNESKVRSKLGKQRSLWKPLQRLGIDTALVVLWKNKTFHTKNKATSYRLASELYFKLEEIELKRTKQVEIDLCILS